MNEPHESRFNPLARLTNAAAGALNVEALLADVDLNELLQRIDADELLDSVDVNRVLDRVDVNRLLDRVDVDRLLDRVDPNRLLDRVHPDRLLDRVDPDRLLDRVDPDALLDRVDADSLVARTDLNAAIGRVDLDAALDRVDVESVVDRAGVPELVSRSTGHMALSILDVARRQLAAVDQIVLRLVTRLLRRDPASIPVAPQQLRSDGDARIITGHYAGPLSRLAAFLTDVAVVFGSFTLISAGVVFILSGFLSEANISPGLQTVLGVVALLLWAFLYAVLGMAIAGRTVGKAILGLRVTARDGSPVRLGQAVLRVLFLPLSFLVLALGFLGLIFGRERRALHDVLAGTVVVYDWGDRPAALPAPLANWLNRRDEPMPAGSSPAAQNSD